MSDSRASPAEVVNHVAGLVSATERTAGFHHLLGDADIDRCSAQSLKAILPRGYSDLNPPSLCSIIVKVKQHEEFFPAFHALVLDILQTLGNDSKRTIFLLI